MSLTFARIVRGDAVRGAVPVLDVPAGSAPARAKIVAKDVVDAAERAREIVTSAEARARQILDGARAEALAVSERAEAEGRATSAAKFAQIALSLSRSEAESDRRATARLIEVARLLAERLIGETLRLEPSQIVALAEHAISEARGARRITIVAHPADASELERALAAGRLERVARVVTSDERGRGSLRFETELGVLDAELAPQLDRLAEALRVSLSHDH